MNSYNQPQPPFSINIKIILSTSIIAGSMILTSPLARAADYYVSTTGSDARSGAQAQSPATPWKTLTKAGANVPPGSVVHVASGVYNAAPTDWRKSSVYITKSGTASSRITFISDTKWGAKIQGGSLQTLLRIDGNYIDIKNFEFIGSGSVHEGVLVTGSYNRIIGNKIHGITGSGIMTWNESYRFGNIDIFDNYIYDIGTDSLCHGIYVMHQGGRVSNNIVRNSTGYGIHAWHAANGLVLSNNLVFNNKEGGITVGAGDEPYNVVANNFIVNNNISIYNGKYGIDENGATGNNNVFNNNLVYGNGWAAYDLNSGRIGKTLQVSPMMVNFNLSGTGNYHLTASSPAINAGTAQGAPASDYDGKTRSGTPDIGPYEYK